MEFGTELDITAQIVYNRETGVYNSKKVGSRLFSRVFVCTM